MSEVEPGEMIAAGAAAVFAVLALGLLAGWWFWRGRPARTRHEGGKSTLEFPCENCSRTMIFDARELVPLSASEIGLVVRAKPDWVRRKLADYDCPYCSAAHVFAVDRKTPEFVGCDLYTPQVHAGRCLDCNTPLATPPWPAGSFDGRVSEAPELRSNFGLSCDRCGAVCCVACCEKATRGRTPDGSLLCPRCFRGPLTKIFNP